MKSIAFAGVVVCLLTGCGGGLEVARDRATKLVFPAGTRRLSLQSARIVEPPSQGSLSADGNDLFYFPKPGYVGSDAFAVDLGQGEKRYQVKVVESEKPANFKKFGRRRPDGRLDFLWILDNSLDMYPKLRYIVSKLNNFTQKISEKTALDWQMAIGSTDTFLIGSPLGTYGLHSGARINTVDGEFCSGAVGTACPATTTYPRTFDLLPAVSSWDPVGGALRYPVNAFLRNDTFKRDPGAVGNDPLHPPTRRVAKGGSPGHPAGPDEFAEMLRDFVPDCGPSFAALTVPAGVMCGMVNSLFGFWEEGLRYMSTLLDKTAVFREFSREGVPLVVAVISSADDYSCDPAVDPAGCTGSDPQTQNPPPVLMPTTYFSEKLKAIKEAEGSYAYFFAFVPRTDADLAAPCYGESIGNRYLKVAKEMGGDGFTGNLCDLSGARAWEDTSLGHMAEVLKERGFLYPKPDGTQTKVFVSGSLAAPPTPVETAVGADSFLKLPEAPAGDVLILTADADQVSAP